MTARDPLPLIRLHGGAVRTAVLVAHGISRHAIGHGVANGSILRVGHGAVASPEAGPTAVLAARTRSVSTCVTALAEHQVGLVVESVRPHLATGHHRTEPGAVWHRDRLALPAGGLLAATLRAASCLPEREALAAVDNVLFQGLLDRRELVGHRLRAATPQARWVLEHCTDAAESILESLLRHLLLRSGIDRIELQARVPGVGRVDVLIDGWLIVEADGHAFHSDRESIRRDNGRSAAGVTQGYLTLRFGYSELVEQPGSVLDIVQASLCRARDHRFRTR